MPSTIIKYLPFLFFYFYFFNLHFFPLPFSSLTPLSPSNHCAVVHVRGSFFLSKLESIPSNLLLLHQLSLCTMVIFEFLFISYLEQFSSQPNCTPKKCLTCQTKCWFFTWQFFHAATCMISHVSLEQQRRDCTSISQFTTKSCVVKIAGNCAVNIFMVFFPLLLLICGGLYPQNPSVHWRWE